MQALPLDHAVVCLLCRINVGTVPAPGPHSFTDTLPPGLELSGSVSGSPTGTCTGALHACCRAACWSYMWHTPGDWSAEGRMLTMLLFCLPTPVGYRELHIQCDGRWHLAGLQHQRCHRRWRQLVSWFVEAVFVDQGLCHLAGHFWLLLCNALHATHCSLCWQVLLVMTCGL